MDLFNDNIDLVKKIVNKMNYGFVAKDDLMQAGLMGLFHASKNYKTSENVKFPTYATYYIIGEIKKELRENKLIKLSKKTYKTIRIIKENEKLSIDEIANRFNIDKEEILDAYLFMNNLTSLDNEVKEKVNLLSIIPDNNTRKSYIIDAIDTLDNDSKQIIKLRYFQNYSQTELVSFLGKNQSKISRIEKKALQIIRKVLLSK